MRYARFIFMLIFANLAFANCAGVNKCNQYAVFIPYCDKIHCCQEMGGISYCDSAAGRYVCMNGYYSTCYCTRHAIMDIQKLEGCCLWQGGVMTIDERGVVVCNNGGASEICSLQITKAISTW